MTRPKWFDSLLGPATRRMRIPPGELKPRVGDVVIVASAPRSGTHLVIDLLLNHFASLRGTPLYVDFDRLLEQGAASFDAAQLAGYVVKTHYPFFLDDTPEQRKSLEALLAQGGVKIIVVNRDRRSIEKSFGDMFQGQFSQEEFDSWLQGFENIWSRYSAFHAEFSDLINASATRRLLSDMSLYIAGIPCQGPVVLPIPKSQWYRSLYYKVLTRLFGGMSPRISTGIRLSRGE